MGLIFLLFFDQFLKPFRAILYVFSQGKFIRIHFGPTGKLASADIDMCELRIKHCILHVFLLLFKSNMSMLLFCLSFRPSGKIQSDISAAW